MTTAALWTKHRPVALAIARDYRIPGMDPDDVRQEALVALWEACRAYDKTKGPFPVFARTVVNRRCVDLLRTAQRGKHRVLTDAGRDQQLELVPAVEFDRIVEAREWLREAVAAPDELTTLARRRRSWRESKRRARPKTRRSNRSETETYVPSS